MHTDGSVQIAPLGTSDSATAVQLRLIGRMPLGRAPVRLQWQVAPLGTPFTSTAIISGTSSQWTDVLTTGVVITQNVTGLTPDTPYHWRVRLLYRPGNRLGQSAGRWIHVPWNGWAEADFRTAAGVPIAGLSAVNDGPTTLGQLTTLTATVTAGTDVSYAWAFGDGEMGSGSVVTHTYPDAGVYTAVVTASNSVSVVTATTAVTITDVPIAGLSAVNDSPTLAGWSTTLTATVTAGSNVTYTWAFGDGSTGSGSAVGHTYPDVGVYTAVVTASNSVSVLTATTTVTVTPRVITYAYDPLNRLIGANYSTPSTGSGQAGESFEYAYDAVGNRTAYTATIESTSVTTYTYDAANRLTSAGGVAYTWDDRGNLTHDGVFTYTYNAAGRLVRAQGVTVTLVYTYNASGLRVAQSVDGDETTFAWDWASGLPEMLSQGTDLYLVGHETLGEWDGAAWAYHLPDALGSVRQVADGAGYVTSSREWTPYGVGVDGTQAGLGYTGEWQDPSLEMTYLRARWYDAYLNQFVSPDPIVPDYRNPQSIHRYLYAFANPVNLTDPSGLFAIGCGPETRNLTDWLVREMYRQSNSWPVQQGLFGMGIAPFNEIGSALLDDAWSDSDIWLHALAGQILDLPGLGLDAQQREELDRRRREAVTGMLLRGTAGLWWANMVKDGARWDFKDVIKTRLGESVMLCGTDECGWFEFSMPGNLFFSYVGRVAGFSEFEIRTGAIYAQQTDPENVWWLNTWYGLDQATDVAALELGFELYNLVGGAVSEDLLRMHFKYLVTMYRNRLAQADEPIEPYFTDFPIGLDGPKFPLRYFDGQNCLGIFGGG
jgi:RHS repeat-associated protein